MEDIKEVVRAKQEEIDALMVRPTAGCNVLSVLSQGMAISEFFRGEPRDFIRAPFNPHVYCTAEHVQQAIERMSGTKIQTCILLKHPIFLNPASGFGIMSIEDTVYPRVGGDRRFLDTFIFGVDTTQGYTDQDLDFSTGMPRDGSMPLPEDMEATVRSKMGWAQ